MTPPGFVLKNLLINAGLLVASTLLMGVLAELAVRWLAPQAVMPRFMIDSGFGNRVPAPESSYRHTMPGDYSVHISTNAAGARGRQDYPRQRPAGGHRVCLLGDSFVFGYGVNDDEVVSAVLQRELQQRAARARRAPAFEVLNFGVSGYGQAEQLNLYRNRLRGFGCNDVLLFYFSNDPGNNVVAGLFRLDPQGALVRDREAYLPGVSVQAVYAVPLIGGLLAHSHLWSLVRNRASALVHKRMLHAHGLSNYSKPDAAALALTVALLRTLAAEVESDGARFGVFVIPDAELQTNFPFECLDDLAAVSIDGRRVMHAGHYYEIDGHWRPSGHRAAALAVLERFYRD